MTSRGRELAESGSILLVSTYELGRQPVALASALGFLARAGYRADALDVAAEGFDTEKVAAARFVGVSVPMHTALRLGVRVAGRIRDINQDCHLCFFGLYAALNAEHLFAAHGVDSVIGGEFEAPLVAWVQALNSGGLGPVAGVAQKGQPAAPYLRRLDFPVPVRSSLPPLEKYARLADDGTLGLVGTVEASRGCKHLCLHCPIPPVYGGRFFIVPRHVVLEDVRSLVTMGAKHITFADPDFLNGPLHSLRIVRTMSKESPGLTFDFTAKIEHILKHAEIFPELYRLGCLFVVSAVESLSNRVLANLDKGHCRADVFRALKTLRGAGIALRPSFVAFTPWTTIDDYVELLDTVASEGLIDDVDPVQYAIRLLVPPGSYLLSRTAIQPYLGSLVADSFAYTWTHPDPRMDLLHRQVGRLVEQATQREEDPVMTFQHIRAAALAARDGCRVSPVSEMAPRSRKRPPHLTESWFC